MLPHDVDCSETCTIVLHLTCRSETVMERSSIRRHPGWGSQQGALPGSSVASGEQKPGAELHADRELITLVGDEKAPSGYEQTENLTLCESLGRGERSAEIAIRRALGD